MSTSKGADPSSSPADEAVTVGFGGPVCCQDGSRPSSETQRETGGSGGDGLTRNDATEGPEPVEPPEAAIPPHPHWTGESGKRGFQDTRSEQAGGTETGLGVPETGANQKPEDLEFQKPEEFVHKR
jgi:hypothetical protein